MHILIIGGGYLSTALNDYFAQKHQVTIADYPTADITNPESLRSLVRDAKPDLVINAAAWTDTNGAELPENRAKVEALNIQGPLNVAAVCAEAGIPWFHFSTGMMFDGNKSGDGWDETDDVEATGVYAQTKLEADRQLLPLAEKNRVYVLRIHLPISGVPHPRNFLNRMLGFAKAIEVPSSVTVVEDLCDVMTKLWETNAPGGIYNVVNNGTISTYEILTLMQLVGLIPADRELQKMTREELDAITKEKGGAHQTFPVLSTAKLRSLGIEIPEAETSVLAALTTFKERSALG